MSKRVVSRLAALGVTVVWASLAVPGCTITFSPGTGDDADDTDVGTPGGAEDNPTGGAEDNPTGGAEGNPIGGDGAGDEPEEPMTEEELAGEPFEGTDPQELALASAKAEVTTAFLVGSIESLGLNPATVDEAALAELMQQYMPIAAEEADKWLTTLDPSTLPLDTQPRPECVDQFG